MPRREGFRPRNCRAQTALDILAAFIHRRLFPGYLTGTPAVSKTKNASSADLDTPTDLDTASVNKVSAALNTLLADAFALYLKTKNFHWHISGRHFRDYHLLLDEQSDKRTLVVVARDIAAVSQEIDG